MKPEVGDRVELLANCTEVSIPSYYIERRGKVVLMSGSVYVIHVDDGAKWDTYARHIRVVGWRCIDENETHKLWSCINLAGERCAGLTGKYENSLGLIGPDAARPIDIELGMRGYINRHGPSDDYLPKNAPSDFPTPSALQLRRERQMAQLRAELWDKEALVQHRVVK